MTKQLPKAELHLHLEGATPPAVARKLAKQHNIDLPEAIFGPNDSYKFDDFLHFLKVYDSVASAIRTQQDYYDLTFAYLKQCAEEGVIYCELSPSPDHAATFGLNYKDMIHGIAQAIDDAEKLGITGRIITTCVRHFGVDACVKVAEEAAKHPHPYVVGFGMGGDEAGFPPGQFAKAYNIAHDAGLHCTVHSGEHVGPEGIIEALDNLPIKRLGHGVRAIESKDLIKRIIDENITLEVAITSNIVLDVYPNVAAHPFLQLRDAGVNVTLNSDDPPFFGTTIGREYEVANEQLRLDDKTLVGITRIAIENSFASEADKTRLLAKL